jgi:hypothetical protein
MTTYRLPIESSMLCQDRLSCISRLISYSDLTYYIKDTLRFFRVKFQSSNQRLPVKQTELPGSTLTTE